MSVTWNTKPFDALTPHELHDILRLRTDVFVVEQDCPYPEVDGLDPTALHVTGRTPEGSLAAYARLIPPHDGGPPHIGRVVVHPAHRGRGLAYELMREAMREAEAAFGTSRSFVAAQVYLEGFYCKLGYVRQGPNYDMDGIPHVDMLKG